MEYKLVKDSLRKPELSIIIPACIEDTIGKTLEKVAAYIRKNNYPSTKALVSVYEAASKAFKAATKNPGSSKGTLLPLVRPV